MNLFRRDTYAEEQAASLKNTVKKFLGKLPRASAASNWVPPVQKAIKKYGQKRVSSLISWYSQHIGEEFVPLIKGATHFFTDFERLEKAMILREEQSVVDEISERAAYLVKEFEAYDWPPQIRMQLPLIIQRSIDRWELFVCKLTADDGRFSDYILRHYGRSFIHEWMQLLRQRYGGLSYYHYPITQLIFDPKSKMFYGMWGAWAFAYAGSMSKFDDLLKTLCEGWKT